MSLSKETKIRILEDFYALDYILFGKPFKSIKLKESDCSICNEILEEEYISTKAALLGTLIDMYKLIEHSPSKIEPKIDPKVLNKMACESAKIARKNASILIRTPKGRNSIKSQFVNTVTENTNIDITTEVEKTIRAKAYSISIDNLLISRAVSESTEYKEMDSYMGRIIEDAYKILRDSLVETSLEINSNLSEGEQKKN